MVDLPEMEVLTEHECFRLLLTVVAFEIDEFAPADVRTGWSVVAVGTASEVTDPADLDAVRQLGLLPWAGGVKEFYLRVDIELISGRRLRTHE